ncbi:hypothetical protein HG531_003430 [Fusarium graminearum]|nr:hypothetical protein HG531_003430 [Fusarium graminearum]
MFADVLNAPVTKLAMCHNVNVGKNLLDTRTLLRRTVLKNVLHNKTTSFPKGYFMPHSAQCFVDILHDLRGRLGPAELEKLLPNMASVTMNNRLRDASQKFRNHNGLILFRD